MKIILPLLLLSLAGCASSTDSQPKSHKPALVIEPSDRWIKGTMTRLDDGVVFSFRIEKKRAFGGSATGGVAAIHEADTFRGQYTGILPSGRINTWSQATVHAHSPVAGSASGTGTSFTQWQGRTANAQAVLTNTNGVTIQLHMTIQAGWSPHGMGVGLDNQGRNYQIIF